MFGQNISLFHFMGTVLGIKPRALSRPGKHCHQHCQSVCLSSTQDGSVGRLRVVNGYVLWVFVSCLLFFRQKPRLASWQSYCFSLLSAGIIGMHIIPGFLLVFWEVHAVFFDCIHPFLQLFSESPLLLYTSNLVSFFFFFLVSWYLSISICAAQIFLDVWLSIGEWLTYQGVLPESCLSFFSSWQWLGVGLYAHLPSPCWDLVCRKGFVHIVPTAESSYVQLPCCVQRCFLVVIPCLWHLDVFLPSVPQWILNLWDVRM